MRPFAIATVVVAFALSTLACSAGSAGGSTTNGNQSNGTGGNGTSTGGTGGTASGNGGATCDGACGLYLGCKGIDTADNHQRCVSQCAAQNHSQDELSQFVSLSCADAVAVIDGPPANNNNNGGGTGGSSGSSCDRCQWDGSSCIWLSPNAPVTPACDANCCPGH